MWRKHFLKKIPFFFIFIFLLIPLVSHGSAFFRNLSYGTQGSDVTLLQKILNLSPQTQVASTGPGSPGNETSWFGPATKKAVAKFQTLYASEVLYPIGLTRGTSYVGSMTLKKLEALAPLLLKNTNPQTPAAPDSSSAAEGNSTPAAAQNDASADSSLAPASSGAPVITSLTKQGGALTETASGTPIFDTTDTIIITGKNFTKSNTITISSEPPMHFVSSPDGTSLSFTLNSVITAGIAKSIAPVPSDKKQAVIDAIIQNMAATTTDSALKNGIYVPVTVSVENANGLSFSAPAVINVAKGL